MSSGRWVLIGVAIAVVAIFVIGLAVGADESTKPATAAPTGRASTRVPIEIPASLTGPKLALVSASCTSDPSIGYITCEGFVKNISGSAIDNVEAVAIFHDASGKPVSSDDALIDYDPLLADQQSPFKVLTRYNPGFEEWTIEFKELGGTKINTRDDR